MKTLSDINLFVITTSLAIMASIFLTLFFDFRGVNALIVVHVILGSLAFVIGGVTLIARKGGTVHKVTGKMFYISMTLSVCFTLVVSVMPNHISPSMFQISVLSLYFLIGGKRSLAFKRADHCLQVDKLMAYTVISVSLLIMFYSVILDGEFNPLRTVFGSVAIAFGLVDLILFNHPQNVRRQWLVLHLSKMLGGYTAAVTGFFVAQKILSGYYDWFIPTLLCLTYILFWLVKLKTFKPAVST